MENEMMSLPMVALRGMVVLPEEVVHFDVSREKSLKAIEKAMQEDQKIFLAAQKNIETEDPGVGDVYRVGCVASIKQIVKLPKKISRILVSGEKRAEMEFLAQEEPFLRADIKVVPDTMSTENEKLTDNPLNETAMVRGLKDVFKEYMAKNPKLAKELAVQIEEISSLQKLTDTIAANLPMTYLDAQAVLEETDTIKRYEKISFQVVNEMRIINIK